MQSVSASLLNLVENSVTLEVKPKVIVEFNHNIHSDTAIAQNASGWWGRWWERAATDVEVVDETGTAVLVPEYQYVDTKQTPIVEMNHDRIDFTNYDPGGYADTYNARIEGTVHPHYSETYTFYLTSDDGVRMWIDDELVIDQWITQSATTHTYSKALTRGETIRVVIEHFEGSGNQRLALEFESASQGRQYITSKDVEADRSQEPSIDSDEHFPIEHVVKARRPRSGLPKLILGQSRLSTSNYRWRLASTNAKYKYWIPPKRSAAASPYTVLNCKPQVTYDRAVPTNKIVLHWECLYDPGTSDYILPTYDLYVTTDGDTWNLIASNVVPDSATGRTRLFWNGTAWTTAADYVNYTTIQGVRAVVKTMNKPNVYPALIELSARLELDISEDVVSMSPNRAREEQDDVLPIGHSRTGTCSLELDNTADKYTNDNPDSPFHKLLGKDARLQTWYGYKVGGTYEYVPQGVFYTLDWSAPSDSPTASVNSTDWSRYLQEEKVPSAFYRDRTVQYIVTDLLEQIGMKNFTFRNAGETQRTIPFAWYNDDISVWEALTDLARAEQATFYFDETNTFVWESRDYIYQSLTPDWVLDSDKHLVSVTPQFDVQSNQVTVRYKTLEPNIDSSGNVINSILWQPEGNVVLQSGALLESMTSTQNTAKVSGAELWPRHEGYFKVEGEIMHYRGRTSTTLLNVRRGLMGTRARPHSIDLEHWRDAGFGRVGKSRTLVNGRMKLGMTKGATIDSFYMNLRGWQNDSWSIYGTKMRFKKPSGSSHNMGGIVLNLGTDGHSGYYFELVSTSHATKANIGNVRAFRIMSDGSRKGLPTTTDGKRGFDLNVTPDNWFTVEVHVERPSSGLYTYTMYVNGIRFLSFQDTFTPPPTKGFWGPYIRGCTEAEFEYFYCMNPSKNPSIEERRLLDRRNGDYVSGYIAKEYNSSANIFFDEFGANAHEMREFVVDYSTFPALNGKLLSSNDWEAIANSASFGPFSGRFFLENTSRDAAVVNGEDSSIFSEPITMHLLAYGQVLREHEEKKVIEKSIPNIRKYGVLDVELQNPWIQTRDQAQDIAAWMRDRWAEPTDVVTVECMPNPALQVGDVVAVVYPEKFYTYTGGVYSHKYHVLGISSSFEDGGVMASLTLRRIR